MDFNILEYGAYVATAITGWFVNVLWTAQAKLKKEFNDMEKDMPLSYVRRDEFKDVVKELREGFREAIHPVLSKLDRMEEKMEERAKEADKTYQRKIGQ